VLGNQVIVSSSPNVFVLTHRHADGTARPTNASFVFTGIKAATMITRHARSCLARTGKLYLQFRQ